MSLIVLLFIITPFSRAFAQGELPVDMYTGRPIVSVQLLSIGSHDISIPIGVSYNASGARVGEASGYYGVGWDVQTGSISRDLRGLPDDWSGSGADTRRGWLDKKIGFNVAIGYEVGTNFTNLQDTIIRTNDAYEPTAYSSLNSYAWNYDTEPDVFNYSFGSHSGKFVFDNSDPAVLRLIPFDDIKIDTFKTGKAITKFVITTNTGVKYTFDKKVTAKKSTKNISFSGEYFRSEYSLYDTTRTDKYVQYTSEWKLGKIESPLGATITLGYQSDTNVFMDTVKVCFRKNNLTSDTTVNCFRRYQSFINQRLSSVTSSTGPEVVFAYDNNEMLASITLNDSRRVVPYVKTFNFTYFTSSMRYWLWKIQESSGCDVMPTYIFSYSEGGELPGGYSKSVDFWGYYNGRTNTGLVPKLYYNSSAPHAEQIRIYPSSTPASDTIVAGADRRPSAFAATTGVLDGITYPSGGTTSLEYELNQYYDAFSGQTLDGPGLRIKRVTYYDGMNAATMITKNFVYTDSTGRSSGRLLSRPVFALPTQRYRDPRNGTYYSPTGWSYLIVRTDQDISSRETSGGSLLAYTEVKVYRPGSGMARHQYLVPGTYGTWPAGVWVPTRNKFARASTSATMGPITSGGAWTAPNADNPSIDYERGLIWQSREYPEGDTVPVTWTRNYYQYLYKNGSSAVTVYGLKYDRYPNAVSTTYLYGKYGLVTEATKVLQTEKVITYDATDASRAQAILTSYTYGSAYHRLVTRVDQTGADGTIYSSKMKYPLDYGTVPSGSDTTSAMIKILQDNFRNGNVIEQWTLRKVGATEKVMGASFTWFNDFGTGTKVLPQRSYSLNLLAPITTFSESTINPTTKRFTFDPNYEVTNTWTSYDSYGNTQSTKGRNRMSSAVGWGYSNSLPVFTASNADIGQVAFSDFETTTGREFVVTGNTYYGAGHTGTNAFYPGAKLSKTVNKASAASSYVLSFWLNASVPVGFTFVLKDGSGTTITTYTPITVDSTSGTRFRYFSKVIPVTGVTTSTMSIELQAASLPGTVGGGSSPGLLPVIDEVSFYPADSEITSSTFSLPFGATSVSSRDQTAYTVLDALGRTKFVMDRDKNIRQKTSYHFPSDVVLTLSAAYTFSNVATGHTIYDGTTVFTADSNPCIDGGVVYEWSQNGSSYTTGTTTQSYTYTTTGWKKVYLRVSRAGFTTATRLDSVNVILRDTEAYMCASGAKTVDCAAIRLTAYSCASVSDMGLTWTSFKVTGIDVAETVSTYQWQKSTNGGTTWTNVGTNTSTYSYKYLPSGSSYMVRCKITTTIGRIGYSSPISVTTNC